MIARKATMETIGIRNPTGPLVKMARKMYTGIIQRVDREALPW